MNKALLAIVVTTVIAVIAAGAYILTNQPTDSNSISVDTQTTDFDNNQDVNQIQDSQSTGNRFSGTFMDLLALGENYTCTFDTTDEAGNRTQGTAYVAAGGDKLNGQFTLTQVDGSTTESYVIRDGQYNYIWSSQQPQGYKSKITPEEDSLFGGSDPASDQSPGLSDDDPVDFDCSPWTVDNNKFVPPTNIEFMDTSEVMEQMMEDSIDCSVCDDIPAGTARQQCLQAVGC